MEVLRTTGITAFYTCPYKAHNDVYQPDPKNTYHGDMFNIWVTSTNADFGPLLQYYARQINPDYKLNQALKDLMEKIKMFIKLRKAEAEKNWTQIYQECKMYYRHNQEVWVEWVPDIFEIYKEPNEDWCIAHCYDLKCSTHSWYTWDDMWNLNLQTYIYPMMIMDVWGLDKCKFTYIVWDKWNGKLKKESVIRTLAECKNKVREAVDDYIHNKLMDEYPARENKLCMFCSFGAKGDKTCPLISARKTKIVKAEELSSAEQDLFS